MKKILSLLLAIIILQSILFGQTVQKKDVFAKANNTINKVNTVLAVFQPYLLKARQLFYDAKQLASDVNRSSKALLDKKNNGSTTDNTNNSSNGSGQYSNTNISDSASFNAQNNSSSVQNNGVYNTSTNNSYSANNNGNNNNNAINQSPQNYLPSQSLPINNPATVNNDGTGNWGNQNNGLYGNCLDVLTGTVLGLGEAEADPKSVDVIFVAANESYQLWTPDYARNQVAAQYTSRGTYESVSKWSEVNETEIAETSLSSGQFDQIQNNSQILNAVKNARNYSPSLTEFGKLEGKVFAVRAELENRTVYGLIEVVKHYGTFGSNGYLKIRIKAQGIDNNHNGQIDVNSYQH